MLEGKREMNRLVRARGGNIQQLITGIARAEVTLVSGDRDHGVVCRCRFPGVARGDVRQVQQARLAAAIDFECRADRKIGDNPGVRGVVSGDVGVARRGDPIGSP